ncbi:MAG: antitoxin Xre/MbcA/ParS toxin-binding domain-containing protein [bacterium]
MRSNDSEQNEAADRQQDRKSELDPFRGGSDPRAGDPPLAREFAARALAPLTSNLRNRQGQLDPARIASVIGLTGQQLAGCLDLPIDHLRGGLPPDELETRLEPFAMVIGIVRDVYGGDDKRVRVWLRTPRPELDGKTPNEALCIPSGLPAVVRFVLGAWLGNAD